MELKWSFSLWRKTGTVPSVERDSAFKRLRKSALRLSDFVHILTFPSKSTKEIADFPLSHTNAIPSMKHRSLASLIPSRTTETSAGWYSLIFKSLDENV